MESLKKFYETECQGSIPGSDAKLLCDFRQEFSSAFFLQKYEGVDHGLLSASCSVRDSKVTQRSPICTYISSHVLKVCLITE